MIVLYCDKTLQRRISSKPQPIFRLKNRIHEGTFEPNHARLDCPTSHGLLSLALSRVKGHEGVLRIQHTFGPVVKELGRAGNEVKCMKYGRSK